MSASCFAPWCGLNGKYANPGVCNAPGGHAYKAPAGRTDEAPHLDEPNGAEGGIPNEAGKPAGPASSNSYSPLHPHEPDVPPAYDDEGGCLVCRLLVLAEGAGFRAGFDHAKAAPLWLLLGDLDGLESDIAQYIRARGSHLPGVNPDTITGVPTATANMAMTVIRRNVRRFGQS